MLHVSDLHVSYGAIAALRGASLEVKEGEVVALIGGNGAGKSTLLRTISGILTPSRGDVIFEGRSLRGMADPMATCCQAVLEGTQRGRNHAIAFVRHEPAQWRDERPDRDGDQATQDDTAVPCAASSMDVLR